jgi:glutamate-1-semialdehyde 2,1-aminomutase
MGKMIGGGFPVGAFGGRSDVMQVLDPGTNPLLLPHSGTFSANPITMTAGYVAMTHFDEAAVEKLNALTATAIQQIEAAIVEADVPMCMSGSGSMFRLHPRYQVPTSYRGAYQSPEEKKIMTRILDHLFYAEKIIMVNTGTCMFSTVITRNEVDRLSQGLLNAFKTVREDLIQTHQKHHRQ